MLASTLLARNSAVSGFKMASNVEAPFLRFGSGELLRHVLSMYRGAWGLRPLAAASRHCRNAVRAHVRRGIWMCGGTSLRRVCVATGCTESLPVPWTRKLSDHSMTVAEGRLVVTGGCLDGYVTDSGTSYLKATSDVWRFDVVDHTWAPWFCLMGWRNHHCSASIGHDVYVVSGSISLVGYKPPLEVISPIIASKLCHLTCMNSDVEHYDGISDRIGVACATMGRYLYVAGGARPDYWEPEHQACCDTNRLSRLDTSTGEWVELAPMHNVRRNFCLVAYCGYLYAVGGQENVHDTEYFNYLSSDDEIPPVEDYDCEFEFDEMDVLEVERYSPERDEWENLGRLLPKNRYLDKAAVADGRLWFIWRNFKDDDPFLMRYDAASNTFVRGVAISEDPAGQIGNMDYCDVAVAAVVVV